MEKEKDALNKTINKKFKEIENFTEIHHSPIGLSFIINGRYLTCRNTETFLLKWVRQGLSKNRINKILKEHYINPQNKLKT